MRSTVRLLLDDVRVRTRRELPAWARGPVRKHSRIARRRIVAGTANLLILAGGSFTPVISTRTTSGTETVPSGSTAVTVESWGETGSGGTGTGSACTASGGGGGGAGGYCKTANFAVTTQSGHTWTVTIGAGASSVSTTVVAGTITGWTTQTAAFGNTGATGPTGAGGTGGTGTGGSTTNTTGATGSAGTALGGAGAAGTVGTNGTGNAGGHGGSGTANLGRTLGATGKFIAAYT